MKEKMTRAEFVNGFETEWNSQCQSSSEYESVEDNLMSLWDATVDACSEDYDMPRFKMTLAEKKKYLKWAEEYE